MIVFTVDNETNRIVPQVAEANADRMPGAESFGSEADLASLGASWPMARLVEIWNHLPGVTPVKKFKDRKTAITRIWNAAAHSAPTEAMPEIDPVTASDIEEPRTMATPQPEAALAPEAQHAPAVAPAPAAAAVKATRRKKTPTVAPNANGPGKESKTAAVLALLKRNGGVTLKELMSATGWQAHSVRGFLSGTVGKKMQLAVVSRKAENGERVYSID